jgi:hypothetical protein
MSSPTFNRPNVKLIDAKLQEWRDAGMPGLSTDLGDVEVLHGAGLNEGLQ